MGDDIVAEDIHILLDHRAQILAELLAVLDEVGVDVILKTTYAVVVLDESSTGCFLHHVEHMLAVAHAVEECGEGTEVLSAATAVEQVGVETLKLVHDSAHILDAVGELHAQRLLNNSHEGMTMHHCREVVETVGEGKGLRICIALAHLLDTTVYISQMGIDTLDGLAIHYCLQTEHTMGRGVLRTDIYYIFIIGEEFALLAYQFSVLVKIIY